MKTITTLSLTVIFCCTTFLLSAQNSALDMKFRYRDKKGELKQVNMPWVRYRFWVQSDDYPAYVKWVNQPFAILKLGKHNAALFTDSVSYFKAGSIISYAFYNRQNVGKFDMDYIKTNVCSFVNGSKNPNMEIVSSSKGLYFRAKENIAPNTELTVDYTSISNMFPNDHSVNKMVSK